MRTQSEIENYLKTTFTDYIGIKTVIIGDYDDVTESVLNNMEYPALWVMSPFSRRRIWLADVARWKWEIEALILMHAKPDEKERIRQNFDDTQVLGEAFITKLYIDSVGSNGEDFIFDDVDNVGEWQPKTQMGNDNCNGYLIPISIITT